MNTPDPTSSLWRKSSRSTETNCVEVAVTPGMTAVRDSKNPDGAVLTFTPTTFTHFLTAAKHGRLAR